MKPPLHRRRRGKRASIIDSLAERRSYYQTNKELPVNVEKVVR